jgi:hypothetical protein
VQSIFQLTFIPQVSPRAEVDMSEGPLCTNGGHSSAIQILLWSRLWVDFEGG